MEASGNGWLIAAALWRNVKADNLGVADERRKIPGLEEQFRLGMYGVEGVLWQGIAKFTVTAGERGQRRGTKDRHAYIRDATGPAPFAKHKCQAVPQRQPIRRQLVLPHQGGECYDDWIVGGQIKHGVAELARSLPGEIGLCRIDLDRLLQQHVGVEPKTGVLGHQ